MEHQQCADTNHFCMKEGKTKSCVVRVILCEELYANSMDGNDNGADDNDTQPEMQFAGIYFVK